MARYRKIEIELSPHLLKKTLEFVKAPTTSQDDIEWIVNNFIELSKCDELLTIEEFDLVTKKPTSM